MPSLSTLRALVRNSVCAAADGTIDSAGRQTLLGVGSTLGHWASLMGHGAPVEIDPNALVPLLGSGGSLVLWSSSVLPTGVEEFGTGKTLCVPARAGATLQLTEFAEAQKSSRRVYLTVDSINYSTGVVTLTRRYVLGAVVTHNASAGIALNPHTTDNTSTFSMFIIGILWSGPGVYPLSMGAADYQNKQGTELVIRQHPTQRIADELVPIIRSMTADVLVTPAVREARLEAYLETLPSVLSGSYPVAYASGAATVLRPDQLDAAWRVNRPVFQPSGNSIIRRTLVLDVPGIGTASRVVTREQLPLGASAVSGNPWLTTGWTLPFSSHPWWGDVVGSEGTDDATLAAQFGGDWMDAIMHGQKITTNSGTEMSPVWSFGPKIWEVSLSNPVTGGFEEYYSPIALPVQKTSTTAFIEAAKACLSVTPLDL